MMAPPTGTSAAGMVTGAASLGVGVSLVLGELQLVTSSAPAGMPRAAARRFLLEGQGWGEVCAMVLILRVACDAVCEVWVWVSLGCFAGCGGWCRNASQYLYSWGEENHLA